MIISSTRGGASREGTERVVWEARSTMRFRRDLRMNASPTNDFSHSYAYITGYMYHGGGKCSARFSEQMEMCRMIIPDEYYGSKLITRTVYFRMKFLDFSV